MFKPDGSPLNPSFPAADRHQPAGFRYLVGFAGAGVPELKGSLT